MKSTIVDIQVQLGRGEIKTLIRKQNGLDRWQRQWDGSSKGRRFYSTRKSVREMVSYNENRREEVMLCRMRFGHMGSNLSFEIDRVTWYWNV